MGSAHHPSWNSTNRVAVSLSASESGSRGYSSRLFGVDISPTPGKQTTQERKRVCRRGKRQTCDKGWERGRGAEKGVASSIASRRGISRKDVRLAFVILPRRRALRQTVGDAGNDKKDESWKSGGGVGQAGAHADKKGPGIFSRMAVFSCCKIVVPSSGIVFLSCHISFITPKTSQRTRFGGKRFKGHKPMTSH